MAPDGPTLDGQVAIVTGSSSGIGRAIAQRFARGGARVVVNSVRSVDEGTSFAGTLPDAIYVQADVSEEEDAERLVASAVEEWGQVDIVVNNAGTTERIAHDDLDAATVGVWRRLLDVNVIGTWNVIRAAAPHLRENGGQIVNITSLAGVRPLGSSIPYATSKAALNHLTRLLANALGPAVRVNAVAPGLIETPWTQDWDETFEMVESTAPLRRAGTPVDVADAVAGVVAADYMTGQVLVVDGGLHLR